ncbi:hypothetical protein SOCE26_078910 [Sorangium cellulosum]|uniref:Uncharacterized protein n=2 Tax=Sorangium cellulosum TaxID=56 RepID=A0A2L0F488_SORCE|nr:hypothetical protein SOCE26_078910 [Sorangium cellulosum]
MAKGNRMATTREVRSSQRQRRVRVYTAWHPVLVALLEHVLPEGWYQCISEFQLAREPLRVDIVILRRSRRGAPPRPRLLTSVVGELAEHTLVHFKGPTDELERDDARMLLAYALVVAEIDDPGAVALRVLAPRLTPRFTEALRSLGCTLTPTGPGTQEGRLGVFPLRVVETVAANAREGEHLLYTVTPGMVADPGGIPALSPAEVAVFWALLEHVEQVRHPLPGQRKRHMKDEKRVVESFEQALARLVARLPPEQRLAGLAPEQVLQAYAPEQRLAGLAPEQRLAGLTEAQAVLALPDAMLRALSEEYLATLPRQTQAAIQKRLGAASGRQPARRRRTRGPSK